jgi:hypothetical protein
MLAAFIALGAGNGRAAPKTQGPGQPSGSAAGATDGVAAAPADLAGVHAGAHREEGAARVSRRGAE